MQLLIDNVNMHNHSIIVIKDTFNEFYNRFLVYNDTKWDCKFFLNYKENINNESYIKEHLSNELKIPGDCINLKYVTSKIHEKYSESDKMNKIYSHKFYLTDVVDFSEILKKDVFEIDGRTYYWMSMSELESDQNVLKKNSDIVSYVKEAFKFFEHLDFKLFKFEFKCSFFILLLIYYRIKVHKML